MKKLLVLIIILLAISPVYSQQMVREEQAFHWEPLEPVSISSWTLLNEIFDENWFTANIIIYNDTGLDIYSSTWTSTAVYSATSTAILAQARRGSPWPDGSVWVLKYFRALYGILGAGESSVNLKRYRLKHN